VIPGDKEVDLKKAAKLSGNKKVEMIAMKELLPLTGYIRGGCCPIGMKKPYPTWIHSTCVDFPFIFISAGVRGLQLKINPSDLLGATGASVADLIAG
jgi:Cys-tRNA(Pro)/Cys-tRNA(Cys) deacylase